MSDLYRFYGLESADREWKSDIGARTIDECRKLLLFLGESDNLSPFTLHLFGYHAYSAGKRHVRIANKYIVRYVVGGKGRFNGKPISRGDCYISVPGCKYTIESDPDHPLVHYWFELHSGKAPLCIERMFGSTEAGVYRLEEIEPYEAIFYELLFKRHPGTDIPVYCYSAFFHLLSLHTGGKQQKSPTSGAMRIYLNAVDYIESHYQKRIRVSDLCDYLHIVPDYLYKIFKQYSGISTQEYILQSKMNMAALLLTTTEDSVADIAHMVGYDDAGRFSKTFRTIYGITPTEYRREKKEGIPKK